MAVLNKGALVDYSAHSKFEFRRKFWKIFGAKITVFDPASETPLAYIKMKALKLREDIGIYTDRSQSQELMRIKARQVIDFGATYDVTDSTSGQIIFSLQRKGLRSTFVRDRWNILEPISNSIVGTVQETSSGLAIARRWFGIVPYVGELIELIFAFIPQTYSIFQNGPDGQPQLGATIIHRKNPLVVKMAVDMTGTQINMDHRIVFASTSLLSINDAVKNS